MSLIKPRKACQKVALPKLLIIPLLLITSLFGPVVSTVEADLPSAPYDEAMMSDYESKVGALICLGRKDSIDYDGSSDGEVEGGDILTDGNSEIGQSGILENNGGTNDNKTERCDSLVKRNYPVFGGIDGFLSPWWVHDTAKGDWVFKDVYDQPDKDFSLDEKKAIANDAREGILSRYSPDIVKSYTTDGWVLNGNKSDSTTYRFHQAYAAFVTRNAFSGCFEPDAAAVGDNLPLDVTNDILYGYKGSTNEEVAWGEAMTRVASAYGISIDDSGHSGANIKCSELARVLSSNSKVGDLFEFAFPEHGVEALNSAEQIDDIDETVRGSLPDIISALTGSSALVMECLKETSKPTAKITNESGVAITTKSASGQTYTIPGGESAIQDGADALAQLNKAYSDLSPEGFIAQTALNIVEPFDPQSGNPFLVVRTLSGPIAGNASELASQPPYSTLQDPAHILKKEIYITSEEAKSFIGCMSIKIPNFRALLTFLGDKLQDIENAYGAAAAVLDGTDAVEDTRVADDCLSKDDFMGWIVCPILSIIDTLTDEMEGIIQDMLKFDISGGGTANPEEEQIRTAWNIFRSLATAIIVLGFLFALVVKGIRGE